MTPKWDSDITVTKDVVEDVISHQFPELRPVSVETLGEGWDNAVFLINRTFVFRFPRRQVAAPLLYVENQALPKLSTYLPIPISAPTLIGVPSDVYPFPFSGYRRLEGTPPHMLNLSDEVLIKSAPRWGSFLSCLHRVPSSQAVAWNVPDGDLIGRMDVEKRVPMFLESALRVAKAGWLGNVTGLVRIAEDASCAMTLTEQHRRCVVHGDLNFRNYLVNDEGVLSAVLDWGDVHIGHPAMDLSVLYSFLPARGREAFHRAYGDVSNETLQLARFRSLYTNIVILEYAHNIGDKDQFAEAQRCIERACDDYL